MKEIDLQIQSIQEEMIQEIQKVIQIRSVEDRPKEGMPFGEGVDRCLRYTLDLAKRLGFRVKYGQGYYGYAEMGEGEEIIGILGHLDVVPEGDLSRWVHPPYGGIIEDGKIYGRGAVDDKGPTIAALYGMKVIQNLNIPLKKRVRILFGVHEEGLWVDMDRYKKEEELPTCGFTPDGDYPMIAAEKGLLQFRLFCKNESSVQLWGGSAYNMVPDQCQCIVRADLEKAEVLKTLGFSEGQRQKKLTAKGKSAHSSRADEGENAICKMCEMLYQAGVQTEAVRFVAEMVGEDCYAEKIFGICEDEHSGKLTFNIGRIEANQNGQTIEVDIRFPVSKKKDDLVAAIQKAAERYHLMYHEVDYVKPLYVSEKHPLIRTLRKIYEEETGLDGTPISSGGATYARVFENFVAFGPRFPEREQMAHQADEYIRIDDLMKTVKIYARAIQELASSESI